ncbi:MAG: hypothetical protein AAB602_02175, partial [Patescibacteria group bacterium]
ALSLTALLLAVLAIVKINYPGFSVDTSDVTVDVVWYTEVDGKVSDGEYALRSGRKKEAGVTYRPASRKLEYFVSSDPAVLRSKEGRDFWQEAFQALEQNGSLPKLPLSFVDGEYAFSKIDFDNATATMLRKSQTGYFAKQAEMPFSIFGSRPYLGPTFRIAELNVGGKSKYWLVNVNPAEGREGKRVTLSLRW